MLSRERSSLPALKNGTCLASTPTGVAGARIAARASLALAHRKCAEAAQLHAVAPFQGGGDLVEDDIDDLLDLTHFQRGVLFGEALDEFGPEHGQKFALSGVKDKSFSRASADGPYHSGCENALSGGRGRIREPGNGGWPYSFFLPPSARAAPRMSPSEAPESAEPYCSTASFSSRISQRLDRQRDLAARLVERRHQRIDLVADRETLRTLFPNGHATGRPCG